MISKVSNINNHQRGLLHCVYSDVCGTMQTATAHGEWYFVNFIDGYLNMVQVKLLKHKSKVFYYFKAYVACLEVETGRRVNHFRNDGGGEYISKDFKAYLKDKRIKLEETNVKIPQENRKSKHMNRTLLKITCTLLEDSQLSKSFWDYAILYVAYVYNCFPSRTLQAQG